MSESRYYNLARQAARIITLNPDPVVAVKDVVLYGSALRGNKNPSDVDLLLLHHGTILDSFSAYEEIAVRHGEGFIELDSPSTKKGNLKISPSGIFNRLSYDFDSFDGRNGRITGMIEDLLHPPHETIDAVFDVNVLDVSAFEPYGETLRAEAVRYCRDPTFWSTVMQTGRIYNPAEDDFTMPIRIKYPSALDIFPATEEEARELLADNVRLEF